MFFNEYIIYYHVISYPMFGWREIKKQERRSEVIEIYEILIYSS